MNEDIGYFEVAVDDAACLQIAQPLVDIGYDIAERDRRERGTLLEQGLEVALVTEFSDYVAVTIAGENFVTLKNVWMIELFEDLYLGEEKLL